MRRDKARWEGTKRDGKGGSERGGYCKVITSITVEGGGGG